MALFFYKEKNKDIRAAAYLRLSIEDGDKAESNSIGNQRELIRDFAAERPGLHLVEEYADDGYTGTNFERPGFKRMMEDSRKTKLGRVEWNPGTLAGVLANERHCGDVLARKTFTPNFLTHTPSSVRSNLCTLLWRHQVQTSRYAARTCRRKTGIR